MIDTATSFFCARFNSTRLLPRTDVTASIALLPAFFMLLLLAGSKAYAAEDTIRGTTATTMPHPELMPIGIHTGGYTLLPSLAYVGVFDDNVFATNSNRKSSYVSELTPSISARSNWGNHALNFLASSNIGKNHTFSSEDFVDWDLKTDGKLTIRHDIKLTAGAGVGRDHVPRTAPNDVRGTEPTKFDKASFFTRYAQSFGKITTNISLNAIEKLYRDVPAIRQGIAFTLDNSDRDRTEYTLNLRLGYRYVGDELVFIRLRNLKRDYKKRQNFTGFDRSSDGIEATLGATFDYHGSLLGSFAAGYRSQRYKTPFPDINVPIVRTAIQWNITDLTTTSFNLDRTIRETIDRFFSGYIATTATLKLDHEIQRNLLLNLSLLYARQDYQGIEPANRNDKTYDIIAGSTYKFNRNLYFSVQYHYLQRKSDANTTLSNSTRFDFTKNLIFFQLKTQY